VYFTPTVAGATSPEIETTCHNGQTSTAATPLALSGTGITEANLNISASGSFGTVAIGGGSSDVVYTITNTSTDTEATSVNPVLTNDGSGAYSLSTTCGASIGTSAPSNECTVTVTFAPSVTGTISGELSVGYNTGLTGTSETEALSGNGVNPASLSLSGSTSFGSVDIGDYVDHTFTLSSASGRATATSLSITDNSSHYSIRNNTCGSSLLSGSSCTFTVRFLPGSAGTLSATVRANYFNGVSSTSTSRSVSGTGVNPVIAQLFGFSYDFGDIQNNTTATHTFTLHNHGDGPATMSTPTGLAAPFSITSNACTGTLNPGVDCDITIQFAPTSVRSYNDSAVIPYYNGSTNTSVSLIVTGISIGLGNIVMTSGDTTYGTRGYTDDVSHSFTFKNTGDGIAYMSSCSGMNNGFRPDWGSCFSLLRDPGGTCTMDISFEYGAEGFHNGVFSISYNDGLVDKTTTLSVTGTVQYPNLQVTSGNTNFGTVAVGSSLTRTITITNTATYSGIGGISSTTGDNNGFYIESNNCPGALSNSGPGASCTYVIRFQPSSTGSKTGTFTINFSTNPPTPFSFTVTGTGG
jgi:hypothetical protein